MENTAIMVNVEIRKVGNDVMKTKLQYEKDHMLTHANPKPNLAQIFRLLFSAFLILSYISGGIRVRVVGFACCRGAPTFASQTS